MTCKCLITMVIVSPLSRATFPFQTAFHSMAYSNGGDLITAYPKWGAHPLSKAMVLWHLNLGRLAPGISEGFSSLIP